MELNIKVMQPYTVIILAGLLLIGCGRHPVQPVTSSKEYGMFLRTDTAHLTSKYFELWNSKIQPDSLQLLSFGHVAGEYQRFFKESGNIRYLKKAEKALQKAVSIAAIGKAGYQRALARTYISQHRFREALSLAEAARDLGSGVRESQALLFDVHMELGRYEQAGRYLDSLRNFSDFGYLIRIAKWNDHKGRLDATIDFMEQATARAEASAHKNRMLWSYTNLADYYGHAGRIRDSYRYYLKALALDPANAYAKKGIAWIVFSHEKNPVEALRILDSVTAGYQAPEYYLLKSEIADYMGDDLKRLQNLDQYYRLLQDPDYGDMYNAHTIGFFLEQATMYDRALELAKKEVANRPTPESYDLLAYSYFKNGDQIKAEALAERHLLGKTFEPGILWHVAEIYKAGGKLEKVRALKPELLGALYELGPSVAGRIKNL